MKRCKKCGADLTGCQVKTGTSKKTGKPWSAIFCPDCNEANWIQNTPTQPQKTTQKTDPDLWAVMGKLNEIHEDIKKIAKKDSWGEEE